MNKYDDFYIFRKCTVEDTFRIMEFIRIHHRRNHILGNDIKFLLYEHADSNEMNFIICEDKKSNDIVGILGFIPYSLDENLYHICQCLTVVSRQSFIPLLGVELTKRFTAIMKYKTFCGIGTNPKTMVPLSKKFFNRFVGKMAHYYMLNETFSTFRVAKISNRTKRSKNIIDNDFIHLNELENIEEVNKTLVLSRAYQNLPYKEKWYIEKRYFNHPIYHYKVWELKNKLKPLAILIGREISHKDRKVLRFVDFIGDVKYLELCNKVIKDILGKNNYEYADFLLHGVPENVMSRCGFNLIKDDDINIIPNYFEPFIQKNVEIWLEKSHKDMILFKADADNDRPNISSNCQDDIYEF